MSVSSVSLFNSKAQSHLYCFAEHRFVLHSPPTGLEYLPQLRLL